VRDMGLSVRGKISRLLSCEVARYNVTKLISIAGTVW
jgi:hypothetical protein